MLSFVDISIVAAYFFAVIGIGVWAARRDGDREDYLVAGRSIPGWAVLGSLVATEVSAATFLAVPGIGFSDNFNYLQFLVGSIVARFFVAYIFISKFYGVGCLSIYEFLGKRFGAGSQKLGSVLFILTRLLASGVRLMIAATGVSVILDVSLVLCLFLFSVLALLYTSIGGIRSVVWTDCVQVFVFLGAGACALTFLLGEIGVNEFFRVLHEADRLEVFRFTPSEPGWLGWLKDENVFWIVIIFAFIQTTASQGTDHDMVQRLLTAKSTRQAKLSLVLSGFIAIPIATLFLMVGAGLFVWMETGNAEALTTISGSDKAFPTFIRDLAPIGLKGLLLAGVMAAAMSSLDSAMAALSSSATVDLIKPKEGAVKQSRWVTVVFATALGLIAYFLEKTGDQFLWLAFQISSVTYGALLGVFLLGLLTRARGSDSGNMLGAVLSLLLTTTLLILIKLDVIALGWTWLIVIGTTTSFFGGFIFKKGEA